MAHASDVAEQGTEVLIFAQEESRYTEERKSDMEGNLHWTKIQQQESLGRKARLLWNHGPSCTTGLAQSALGELLQR